MRLIFLRSETIQEHNTWYAEETSRKKVATTAEAPLFFFFLPFSTQYFKE